jgi:RNA polymerase-binding transcription factor DksA
MTTYTAPIPTPIRGDVAAHLPDLRKALDQQRRFRLEQLAELASGAAEPRSASDPAEEVNRVLLTGAAAALADIETALHRMATGRYGRCQQCETAIPLGRLEILPSVALCMPCQYARDAARV